jgi:L-ascorbate metabolism protein UlaG (beta-lactamase superfamily)
MLRFMFAKPPISIAELAPIKGMILSHDHYDHLDHLDQIATLAASHDVRLATPAIGQRLDIVQPATGVGWWEAVKQQELGASPATV